MLQWPDGIRGAVSLTYDGLLFSHAETALPLLDELNLKATFFAESARLMEFFSVWRGAVSHGHELGNGALLPFEYRLHDLELELAASECWDTRELIRSLGASAIPFAWPANSPSIQHATRFRPITDQYSVVRTGLDGMNHPESLTIGALRSVLMDGYSADEMNALIDQAQDESGWLILNFAGIGEGEPSVDRAAHEDFVRSLASRQEIVVGTLSRVAELLGWPPKLA